MDMTLENRLKEILIETNTIAINTTKGCLQGVALSNAVNKLLKELTNTGKNKKRVYVVLNQLFKLIKK